MKKKINNFELKGNNIWKVIFLFTNPRITMWCIIVFLIFLSMQFIFGILIDVPETAPIIVM